jgi:hypothetical protein
MQQLTAAAIISIRGEPPSDAYLIEGAEVQIAAVKTDPKRNNGDYYGKEEPLVRWPDDGFQDHPAPEWELCYFGQNGWSQMGTRG